MSKLNSAWQIGYEHGRDGKPRSNPYGAVLEAHRVDHGQYEIGYDYGSGERLQAQEQKWDLRFLELARHVSEWSKDPSTKVGAVITRPDRSIASLGYNGFPRGMRDDAALYKDRDKKLSRVVHAELNAILNAREPLHGYTLYVWPPGYGPTCDRCAAHVIQAGIKRVVNQLRQDDFASRWRESCEAALGMYEEAGVVVKMYPEVVS